MNYIYAVDSSDSLSHHGIKGQKWGVRRFQNPDGTLTNEGRRRYGYGRGAGGLMTQNTAERAKSGLKIGAAIGTGLGAVSGAASGITSVALLGPAFAPMAVAIGAGAMAGTAFEGAVDGLAIGAIVGAVETHKGRKFIERYDKDLRDFEIRDLK